MDATLMRNDVARIVDLETAESAVLIRSNGRWRRQMATRRFQPLGR